MVIGVTPVPIHRLPPPGLAARARLASPTAPDPPGVSRPAVSRGAHPLAEARALQGELLARRRSSDPGAGVAAEDSRRGERAPFTFEARRASPRVPSFRDAVARYAANDGSTRSSGHLIDVSA